MPAKKEESLRLLRSSYSAGVTFADRSGHAKGVISNEQLEHDFESHSAPLISPRLTLDSTGTDSSRASSSGTTDVASAVTSSYVPPSSGIPGVPMTTPAAEGGSLGIGISTVSCTNLVGLRSTSGTCAIP